MILPFVQISGEKFNIEDLPLTSMGLKNWIRNSLGISNLEERYQDLEKSNSQIDSQLENLEKSISDLKQNQFEREEIVSIVKDVVNSMDLTEEKREEAIKHTKTYKNIIKREILKTVNNREINKKELREIIVNQKNLTSRSTFYRRFNELKKEAYINVTDDKIVKPLVSVKKLSE